MTEALKGVPKYSGRGAAVRYGRVYFDLRRRFALSATDALLVDVIDTLSKRTGWCYASRPYLASVLGVSSRSIRRMILRLVSLDLLEVSPTRHRQLRPTLRWQRAIESIRGGQAGQ